ncbi:hypothetical protein [Bradyrhizobium sp. UFLA05-112]
MVAKAFQDGVCILLLPSDRRAELGAGSAEEMQRVFGISTPKPVEFRSESRNVEPVTVVARHRKAQYRQLPGVEQPARFLG